MAKKTKPLGKRHIVLEDEKERMVDYVLQTWDGEKEDLRKVVERGFEDGIKAAQLWYGDVICEELNELRESWNNERNNYLKNSGEINNIGMFNDDILIIPRNILFNDISYKKSVLGENWDFETITNKGAAQLFKEVKVGSLFPKGWSDVKKSGKSAFEYFDTFTLDSESLFTGHDSSTAGVGGFNHRVNLPSTYYSVQEQGQKVKNYLYACSFAHGLMVQENNNTIEVLHELERLKGIYNNKDYPGVTYLGDLTLISENSIIKGLMVNKYNMNKNYSSQEDLDEFLKKSLYDSFRYGLVGIKNEDGSYAALRVTRIYNSEHFNEFIVSKNVEEKILKVLEIRELDKNDYLKMKDELGAKDDIIIGDVSAYDIMSYQYPEQEEIVSFNAKRIKRTLMKLK